MRRILYKIYILTFLSFCISCDSNTIHGEYKIVELFNKSVSLEKGEPVSIIDTLTGVLDIHLHKDQLIVSKYKNPHFFSIVPLKLESNTPIIDFALKGKGANEFLSPVICETIQQDNFFYLSILDRPKRELYKIDINKTIVDQKVYVEEKLSLPLTLFPEGCRTIFHIGNNEYVGVCDDIYSTPFRYTVQTEKVILGEHVFMPLEKKNPEYFGIFQAQSSCNTTQKKIASAFFYFPMIEIWNYETDELLTIFYKNIIYPYQIDPINRQDYFMDIYSTDDYIYALFLDSSTEKQHARSTILVFNWNGDPILFLDAPYATTLLVSPDNSHIYLCNNTCDKNIVMKYKINEL